MTWKQFKDECERQGAKDEMEIWYIDVSPLASNDITCCPQTDDGPNAIGISIS